MFVVFYDTEGRPHGETPHSAACVCACTRHQSGQQVLPSRGTCDIGEGRESVFLSGRLCVSWPLDGRLWIIPQQIHLFDAKERKSFQVVWNSKDSQPHRHCPTVVRTPSALAKLRLIEALLPRKWVQLGVAAEQTAHKRIDTANHLAVSNQNCSFKDRWLR